MKIISVKLASGILGALFLLGSVPFVGHSAPLGAAKTLALPKVSTTTQTNSPSEVLAHWQYPQGSGYGSQLAVLNTPDFPYGCLQGKTHDSIEKAYAFYRAKATDGLAAEHGFNWQNDTETTLLVNQPMTEGNTRGEIGFTGMANIRHISDNALMIVHQPRQTVIIKLSRDAQNRDSTDISVIIDKR